MNETVANPAPGFRTHPNHSVDIRPVNGRVRVELGGETIADSEAALEVSETGHRPVLYIPRSDVRMDRLRSSDTSSHCPFKGDASYWSSDIEGHERADVAWSYETPYDEVEPITGHLAFYGDRVDRIVTG